MPAALARAHGSEIATVRKKLGAKCAPLVRNSTESMHCEHKVRTVNQKCDRQRGPSDRKEAKTLTEPGQHQDIAEPRGAQSFSL